MKIKSKIAIVFLLIFGLSAKEKKPLIFAKNTKEAAPIINKQAITLDSLNNVLKIEQKKDSLYTAKIEKVADKIEVIKESNQEKIEGVKKVCIVYIDPVIFTIDSTSGKR